MPLIVAGVIISGLLVPAVASGTQADPCSRDTKRYDAMAAELVEALRDYERCIGASQARDTCETEFGDLDLAQARFEKAVQEHQRVCR